MPAQPQFAQLIAGDRKRYTRIIDERDITPDRQETPK